MNRLFEIKNIKSGYDKKAVLHEVSFEINEGEFLGIIGPNGCGKTTLLKTITRTLAPFSGDIIYRGKDLLKMDLKKLAGEMAFVPQQTLTSFSFNILEVVMMGRYPHLGRFQMEGKKDYEIAHNALKELKCLEFIDKDIDEISAGEKQRVIIAKALAQEPSVLVLDEPTSSLDIGHQIEIFDLIKKLNIDKKITVISVLHDLNLAGDYCDRIVLMDKGRVFKVGASEEILTYQNIEKIYKTTVVVNESPATKRPHITLVPKYKSKNVDKKNLDAYN